MLYISFSDDSIEILQGKKNILGKEKIVSSSRHILPPGLIIDGVITNEESLAQVFHDVLANGYPKPIRDTHAAVVISDEQSLTVRLSIHESDVHGNMEQHILQEAKKIMQHDPVEYENFFTLLDSKNGVHNVLYTAMPISTIMHIRKFLGRLNIELSFLTTHSFSFFHLMKYFINPGQLLLLMLIGKEKVEYVLYDSQGPNVASFVKIGENPIENEINRIVQTFRAQHNQALSTVVLGGESRVNTVSFTPLQDLFPQIQKRAHVHFEPSGGNISSFASASALAVSVHNHGVPNFSMDATTFPEEDDRNLVEHTSSRLPFYAMTILGIIALVVGLYMYGGNAVQNLNFFPAQPTSTPIPTILPSITPTPTLDPTLKRSEVKVSVQNGSGKPGYAKEIAAFLEEKGYKNIAKGNADRDDYEKTVVKMKESKKAYLPLILSDLKETFPSPETSDLEESTFDVILILGKE